MPGPGSGYQWPVIKRQRLGRCPFSDRQPLIPDPCHPFASTARSLPAWWPRRGSQDPIPSRTRPSKAPAPMVLCLKAWESRSPPGPQRSCFHIHSTRPEPRTPTSPGPYRPRPSGRYDTTAIRSAATSIQRSPIHGTDAGWSSPVARQAHNLKAAGSNPAPATKPHHNRHQPKPRGQKPRGEAACSTSGRDHPPRRR